MHAVPAAFFFFFQAEDGIRYLVRSRGLGDVYKRQIEPVHLLQGMMLVDENVIPFILKKVNASPDKINSCLLYTSDAADERSSVDLGGRRIIKKKKTISRSCRLIVINKHR